MTTPAAATGPGALHVDDLWAGGPTELRRTLEYAGMPFGQAPEGGLLFACPVTGEHEVHATLGNHADHVELRCLGGCPEDSVRALLRLAAADPHEPLPPLAVENGRGADRPRLWTRRADLARVRPVEWLWPGRLPTGYLALLLGAEGMGKGILVAWLIAQVTRGALPGDLQDTPRRVLIVGDEDSFESVIMPRLYVAGADLDQVDELCANEEADLLDVRRDVDRLRELIREGDYALVYVDQLLDVLAVDTDDWRSKPVRDALRPLRRMARDLNVTLLATVHPNKGARSSFRDLVSGTHAFNASSRSSLLLAQDPDDADRRVLVRGKGNLSAPPPSFEFAIQGRDLEINGHGFSLPLLADAREGDRYVEDLVGPGSGGAPAPVRDGLADQINALGTGELQSRSELARAVGRRPDDKSVERALEQLEDEGLWAKEGRGKWRRIGIGTPKGAPKTKSDGESAEKAATGDELDLADRLIERFGEAAPG